MDPARLKYLEFIQAIITRQASNQFLIKGWSLTVIPVFYGFVATHLDWRLAVVGLALPASFFALDVYFLRQERLFRCLWTEAVAQDSPLATFDLDMGRYKQATLYPRSTWTSVMRSPPSVIMYGTLFAVGILIMIVSVA